MLDNRDYHAPRQVAGAKTAETFKIDASRRVDRGSRYSFGDLGCVLPLEVPGNEHTAGYRTIDKSVTDYGRDLLWA